MNELWMNLGNVISTLSISFGVILLVVLIVGCVISVGIFFQKVWEFVNKPDALAVINGDITVAPNSKGDAVSISHCAIHGRVTNKEGKEKWKQPDQSIVIYNITDITGAFELAKPGQSISLGKGSYVSGHLKTNLPHAMSIKKVSGQGKKKTTINKKVKI